MQIYINSVHISINISSIGYHIWYGISEPNLTNSPGESGDEGYISHIKIFHIGTIF